MNVDGSNRRPLLAAAGSNQIRLTNPGGNDYWPCWSRWPRSLTQD